ncbi:unnamed protein product [Gadus morhua 'NCC']
MKLLKASTDAVLEPGVTVTSVSSERCTLLCAVDQLSGGTLSWYQGEVLVNQSSTQRSLPLTVDRLALRSSYRCVSANPADAVLEPGVTVTSVSSVGCTLLCAVDQLSGGTLSWYQGEVLVNQSSTQRSLPLTVDRLALRSSYRCVSANPAGNLTRSVDANTSCTVQQRTGKKSSHTLPPPGLHRKLKDAAHVVELLVT